MKSKIAIVVILSLALLCTSSICGCGGGGLGDCKDNMKMMPTDSTAYSYWDIGIMDSEADLKDLYYIFKESSEANQIMGIGIARSSVNNASLASGFGTLGNSTARILTVSFEVENMEEALERNGYTKDPYQEVMIWIPPAGQGYKAIATWKDTLLFGNKGDLQACIDVIVEKERISFYDDHNVKLVTDKLPNGVLVYVGTAASAGEEEYADLVSWGKSYRQADELQLELTAIYMFQDNYSAREATDAINKYLGSKPFRDTKIEQQENFVQARAKIYISDFVKSLVF